MLTTWPALPSPWTLIDEESRHLAGSQLKILHGRQVLGAGELTATLGEGPNERLEELRGWLAPGPALPALRERSARVDGGQDCGEFTEGTRRSEEVTQLAKASGRALDRVYAYRRTP